jgi:hypothetical protein
MYGQRVPSTQKAHAARFAARLYSLVALRVVRLASGSFFDRISAVPWGWISPGARSFA